jgi:SAM-dependent methyltransferase
MRVIGSTKRIRSSTGSRAWLDAVTTLPPNHGTGPGPITADGCAVDYYATLRPNGEPERIHGAIPAGASILELGAGTGRITRRLVELGHEVVAVDQSPEMLAHIDGVETVCSSIESLELGRRFGLVLLMSFVIETADDEQRAAFLATCRRHVADGGSVILQRHPPEWYDTIAPIERDLDDGRTFRLGGLSRPAPDLLAATTEYTIDERRWTHFFVSKRLDDQQLAAELDRAGLTIDEFIDGDREWVRAIPRPL